MLKKYYIIFITIIFIQSCGSSSSKTEAGAEYQFVLSAQLTNQCGQQVTFNQFEVHLQDENWNLIEKYSPDTNGLVNFTTDQQHINYTIVAKSQQGASAEGLDIVSYYQANTTTAAIYEASYDNLLDNSTCECITRDIELQHRVFSTIDSISTSFNYENWYSVDSQTTYVNAAEVCRIIGNEWAIQSISIRGKDTNNNAIGVASLLENFSSNIEQLWQPAAIEVADTVSLPQNHAVFEMTQQFANNEHFYVKAEEDDEELLIFNTHPYISESKYQSTASYIFEDIHTIFGQSTFSSHHQIKSSIYTTAFDVSAQTIQPEIDNTSFIELDADGSYDYSAISGYPLVEITFNYQVNTTNSGTLMPINWTMYGPIKGTLASSLQLTGYEDILGQDLAIQSTNIKIIKSVNTSKYDDYISYYQGDKDSDLTDNLHYFQLDLVL